MALNVVTVPAEVQEKSAKIASYYENEDCKKLLFRLINNLQYEQTGRAIMDSIIMTDFSARKFFDLVTSAWDDEDKPLSLYKTKQITDISRPVHELQQNGFVGLQDKLMCMGCGGIVLEIPDHCTMANVHAWLNPVCPAFLEEPDVTQGMELVEWPELDHPVVKERLRKLEESSFHMYSKDHWKIEKRRKTWEDNQDVMPSATTDNEKEELTEAGWYVEPHETIRTVRCFCCGIEVRHMKKDECPMMTHLLASPACPYMHAILDEEDVKAIFAGHTQEVCVNHSGSPAVEQYFQKIWFQPHIVSYERLNWNQRSTYLQKETDKEKMQLVAEWLIEQRLRGYNEPVPPKKQKMTVTRKHLMRQYLWQTRMTDINTRASMSQEKIAKRYIYTPNWKRKERHQRRWGAGTTFNRGAPLIEGDWLIMQQ